MEIAFRRLTDDDLPLLHRWLNEPGVVQWWEGEDVSWDAVVRDYGSGNTDPVEQYLACIGDREVGWIQCYAAADFEQEAEAQHWWALGIDRTAAGIDYLLGDPGDRGRGIGSAMIRAFVRDVVFAQHPQWTQACASPQAANVASCRALEKAGFAFAGTFEATAVGTCQLMILNHDNEQVRGADAHIG